MVRLLPFILIPVLIVGGLGYWRYTSTKKSLTTPQTNEVGQGPLEVPKTLPNASLEDKVKSLEDAVNKLITKVNSLKSVEGSSQTTSSDTRLSAVEAGLTELKARVSSLENTTPVTTTTTSKSTVYIPLGSGGSGGDKGWTSNGNYGATIDPAEYPGYSSMQLEVNFRLTQKVGTAYARLFNVTDNSANLGEVSTTSDSFSWQTSSTFTLPKGKKTYTVQFKSTEGIEAQFQSARIKVNF